MMRGDLHRSNFVKGGKAALAVWVVLVSCAAAQSGGPYVLEWSTIDGGGGVSSGGVYVVSGTIGQPDANWADGGGYELLGGFWPGGPLCMVDLDDFARFAEYWLASGCAPENEWCGGADLNQLGDVDGVDLGLFVDEWLNYCPYGWQLK